MSGFAAGISLGVLLGLYIAAFDFALALEIRSWAHRRATRKETPDAE